MAIESYEYYTEQELEFFRLQYNIKLEYEMKTVQACCSAIDTALNSFEAKELTPELRKVILINKDILLSQANEIAKILQKDNYEYQNIAGY